ncbi:hypothetical protein C3941_21780 [Kaistia algarum]|jgi:hypothetical protein|uniref:hypothetical protein n=1 Tax=Kaistia algarum TaxID=2083279 RepID=UPI000CE7C21F|nr:hypothetical protein [Kaistia algarum]MCX5514043.1 hypothetical protein [Kaistia algarum]PPE77786.1 hypothetical protein C3941_21780 [Kaistia algarum]
MLDFATYYIEYDGGGQRSLLHRDGLPVASFASHDDALRSATNLASSAAELGMYSRVIELGDDLHGSIVFEREPISDSDLPWHALDD